MHRLSSITAALCTVALLSACATSYVAPAGVPTVPLAMSLQTDSTGTTLITARAVHYLDPDCKLGKQGTMLANRLSIKAQDAFETVQIPAGSAFTFSMSNTEARFGRNTGCSATRTFTPKIGEQYHARFTSRGNGASCDIVIADKSNAVVASINPEYSCEPSMYGITQNGTGWNKNSPVYIPVVR